MTRTYKYTRKGYGSAKQEIVILSSESDCDIDQILYQVALMFCLSPQGRRLCKNPLGLTFEVFLDNLKAEMLAPYGVTVYRPQKDAQHKDEMDLVVSKCEIETYQNFCDAHKRQFLDMKDLAKRIAKRLEALRQSGHRAIVTWTTEIILEKSISWAYQYVTSEECDFSAFLERKIQEAKPHGGTEGAA